MALIFCPDCGKQVSSTAKTCPMCGYPIKNALEEINTEISKKEKILQDQERARQRGLLLEEKAQEREKIKNTLWGTKKKRVAWILVFSLIIIACGVYFNYDTLFPYEKRIDCALKLRNYELAHKINKKYNYEGDIFVYRDIESKIEEKMKANLPYEKLVEKFPNEYINLYGYEITYYLSGGYVCKVQIVNNADVDIKVTHLSTSIEEYEEVDVDYFVPAKSEGHFVLTLGNVDKSAETRDRKGYDGISDYKVKVAKK